MANRDRPWRLGEAGARLWLHGEGCVLALSQASHAFTLIHAVLVARGRPEPEIWLPAYYCENGLMALRASPSRLRFYPVTERMTPDWDGCDRMLAEGRPDLFVLTHFFGAENEGVEARAFCDANGALLDEDAAHVLRPVGAIGMFGDFVTYSPRKYLGVPDGGVLAIRGPELVSQSEAVAATLPVDKFATGGWRAAQWGQKLLFRRRRGPLRLRHIDDDPPVMRLLPAVWMSDLAWQRIEGVGSAGLDAIAAREARVVARLDAAMTELDLVPLARHPAATPYMIGFRARGENHAAEMLAQLRAAGAAVSTWPGLPPEVWAEPERYGATLSIRRTLLRFTPRNGTDRRPLDFLDRPRLGEPA